MKLAILGTRGIPAAHGGFETFAERLAQFLVERGWHVTVYCQVDEGIGTAIDEWGGVHRVLIPVARNGALGTMEFDWKCISHLLRDDDPGLVLTLGYNTAVFCARLRKAKIPNIINMDGIEWRRVKWRRHERAWLWLNERAGCWFGNCLVADHPEIANHLATRVSRKKIVTIPYGARNIQSADASVLVSFGIRPGRFLLVVARPEPENSIQEIVRAFSGAERGYHLVLLGEYNRHQNDYHREVLRTASDEVKFPGAIYDRRVVEALRFHCRIYIHGHQVGGTNPSLVEALGAGSAILAHDNRFNRWVTAGNAHYFSSEKECAEQIARLLSDDREIEVMRRASRDRFSSRFTWERVLTEYERLLIDWKQLGRLSSLLSDSIADEGIFKDLNSRG